jgi:uncharacterized membrane protein YqjE
MAVDPPAGTHSGGLLDHLREFVAGGVEYLQARLALAGIEAKEACLHFALIAGLLVLALAVLVFGYLFLWIAVTVLIAQLLGISPGWVILAAALIHFGVAVGAVLLAVARFKIAVFTATLAELRKDRQWLNQASK